MNRSGNQRKQIQVKQSLKPGVPTIPSSRFPVHFYRDLHNGLLKEPVGIAAEDLGDLLLHLLSGDSNSIDDAAEIGLIDTHKPRQTILTHAGRVDPQLQIRVNASFSHCNVNFAVVRIWGIDFFVSTVTLCSAASEEADLEVRALNK